MKTPIKSDYFKTLATYAFGVDADKICFDQDVETGIMSAEYKNVALLQDKLGYHVYRGQGTYMTLFADSLFLYQVPGQVRLAMQKAPTRHTNAKWLWRAIALLQSPLICGLIATIPSPPLIRLCLVIVGGVLFQIASKQFIVWVLR